MYCGVNKRIVGLFFSSVFLLIFFTGCGQAVKRPEAVKLYVDAVEYKSSGAEEKAIEKLRMASGEDKEFSPAYSLLGDIYRDMKDYRSSAEAYEKATELNPWSFSDYFNLGRVYQFAKQFKQAVGAYLSALELKPEHIGANFGAGQAYYQLNDANNALVYGKRASRINPSLSEVQKFLGDVYESQGAYEEAVSSYKRSLELDSNDVNVMVALAVVYLRTSRESSSNELLRAALAIQPDNNVAEQYLGYTELQLGEVDKAIDSYKKAIEIEKKDWQAYRGLGVAYMLKGIKTRQKALKLAAVEYWRKSLELNPKQARGEKLRRLIDKYSQ